MFHSTLFVRNDAIQRLLAFGVTFVLLDATYRPAVVPNISNDFPSTQYLHAPLPVFFTTTTAKLFSLNKKFAA